MLIVWEKKMKWVKMKSQKKKRKKKDCIGDVAVARLVTH